MINQLLTTLDNLFAQVYVIDARGSRLSIVLERRARAALLQMSYAPFGAGAAIDGAVP